MNDWGNGNRTDSVSGEPIYNGFAPTGNFLPHGWQTGTTETWTGFDVLHQGQTAERVLSLDLAAIESAGSVNFRVAIFDKYVDPKSATPGSLHRLPADPPDLLGHFGYRYPHGCWDVSHVAFDYESQGLVTDKPSETTVHFHVRDWDALASVSAESDLSLEPDPVKVLASSAGTPSLRACVPAALGGPAAFVPFGSTPTDDDSHMYQRNGDVGADSGQPRDELYYRRTISSPTGVPASAGNRIWGVLEVADIEATLPGYQKVLDGNLQPLTTNLPGNVTYQVFALDVQPRSTQTGWAASGEGAGNNWASAVAYDSLGNVYYGGSFLGSISLGGTTYTSAGSTDCFVAKYSLTGTFEWAQTWGGTGADEVTSLLISDDDMFSLKVGGTFSGTVNFDPPAGSPRTAAAIDMFVLQLLSTNGSFTTVRTYGSPGVDVLTCLADNGNRGTGDYFIAGYINGPVNFGGGHILTPVNPLEGFVAGMDRITNNAKSAYVLASGDYSTVSHMSLFEDGELGIAGVFVDSLTGPWGAEPGSGDEDIYLARLAMSTTPGASGMNWVYTSNLEGTESVGGLHAFSSGSSARLLMARNYTYPDPVTDGYSLDLLLLNLIPLRSQGIERLHSFGIQRANSLAVRPGSTPEDLTFYITGYKTRPTYSSSFYFFGEPTLLGLPSGTDNKDGFVWALSGDGSEGAFRTAWAREFGGDQGEEGLAIAAGPAAFGVEAIAIGGTYQSTTDFAPGPELSILPVVGGTEAFVTQWPADGVW
ncbi:MAG: hypothetical protein GEEBNDBF_01933 [bacterium]|nr:hypothetical protein [bacterium]